MTTTIKEVREAIELFAIASDTRKAYLMSVSLPEPKLTQENVNELRSLSRLEAIALKRLHDIAFDWLNEYLRHADVPFCSDEYRSLSPRTVPTPIDPHTMSKAELLADRNRFAALSDAVWNARFEANYVS